MIKNITSVFRRYLKSEKNKVSQQAPLKKISGGKLLQVVQSRIAVLKNGTLQQRRKATLELHSYAPALNRKDSEIVSRGLRKLQRDRDSFIEGAIDGLIQKLESKQKK